MLQAQTPQLVGNCNPALIDRRACAGLSDADHDGPQQKARGTQAPGD
jgi:hypothetical protein